MARKSVIFACVLVLALFSTVNAQVGQTGSIRGIVTDTEGAPLPGVAVTITSPALIGSENPVTNENGVFRVPALPPGTYTIKLEMPGFKTVIREGIIVRVGQSIEVRLSMEQPAISEEIVVTGAPPVIDLVSTKVVENISKETLQQVPLSRSIYSAIQIAPGTVDRSIHGSARNDNAYMIDGVQTNAPDQNYGEAQVSWDMIEEVELIVGSPTSEAFNAIGGVINVVTKSGGNNFSGSAQVYYTNEDLSQVIVPVEDLEALEIGEPGFPKYDYDLSGTLGGPIMKDKLWFLTNVRTMDQKRVGAFRPTTILGKQYGSYDWTYTQYQWFGKISTMLSDSIRAFVMVNWHAQERPNISNSWNRTLEANTYHKTNAWTGTANVNWTLDANTYVDLRGGFWYFNYDGKHSVEEATSNPAYSDAFTGYSWNSKGMNDFTRKRVYQGSIKLTRFQDDFLGGDHEFKAGVEIDRSSGGWGFWRVNPLSVTFYNENIYYYRGLHGTDAPVPGLGDGRISFQAIGPDLNTKQATLGIKTRYGLFVQDAWTIKNRLTLNLGFRFDHITAGMPTLTKFQANSDVALALGETIFVPQYGFNPFKEIQFDEWKDAFPYDIFLPSFGFTFDVFGDGKTALKGSYGQYAEGLPTWYYDEAHPISPAGFNFNWWDLNGNRQVDLPGIDMYEWTGGANPRAMVDTSDFDNLIDPNVKIPRTHEYHLTLEQELFTDFRLSVGYIFKNRVNNMSNPRYDLDTGQFWHTKDSGYWVPFSTVIPAVPGKEEEFPAVPLTMYFLKEDHPDFYNRVSNVDAKVRYSALEISFLKNMSHGWQLGGSLVLSSHKGSFRLHGGWVYGQFDDPNQRINDYGYLPLSRPLMIKLWGSVTLPFRFIGSFFYRHMSGSPWERTISVVPPSDWAAANGVLPWSFSAMVEPRGSRRNVSTDNMDFRLEKEFLLGRFGKMGVFADIFNIFGSVRFNVAKNPGGTWRPEAPNSEKGTYPPGWTGLTGHSGVRTFRFSVRYSF